MEMKKNVLILGNGARERVMTLVSVADTLVKALNNIYDNIKKIKYHDIHYRTDIGINNISLY